MTDALEDREGTVSIGGRTITNLCFADDIDGLAGVEEELANLVEHLDKASTAYGMETSAEKTKLMTNNTSGFNTEIKVNGQKLETITSFKYLVRRTSRGLIAWWILARTSSLVAWSLYEMPFPLLVLLFGALL